MYPINLISGYQSASLLIDNQYKTLRENCDLKSHEVLSIIKLIDNIKKYQHESICFSGFYIGYKIEQIGKEFDLLKFVDNGVINVELKSALKESIKYEKIKSQMQKNYHYLKSLQMDIYIFTFVEDDEIYRYNASIDNIEICTFEDFINIISFEPNYNINPDDLFIPSNYLVSPFNNTQKFLNDEYFLTNHQEEIKKKIIININENIKLINCISANAGTGKTLLTYDIAKHFINNNDKVIIIHCANLNMGQEVLNNDHNWNIYAIKAIRENTIDEIIRDAKVIIIDESQRISSNQLELIFRTAIDKKIHCIFSYDKKQFLHRREHNDTYEELYNLSEDKTVFSEKYTLSDKIRTNKELASFIRNLFIFGSVRDEFSYEKVTIEYFNEFSNATKYYLNLQEKNGWTAITFTSSQYNMEGIRILSYLCPNNPHSVIGQEFDKVLLILDDNFGYDEQGHLNTTVNYYSVTGMLYQIVTRAVNEIKIIVVNNPEFYKTLLRIKYRQF